MPTQGNLAFDFSPKHRILWVDRLTATQAVLSDGQRIRLKDGAIVGRPGPAVHAQAVTPKFMKRHLHELEMSRRNSAAMAVLTGMIQSRKRYKAVAMIAFNPPKEQTQAFDLDNPIGLFVTDLNWSEQL